MAKAPVAGQAKTRLGSVVGAVPAAELAAAALLDTLDVCEAVFDERHLALAGDLDDAEQGGALLERLASWTVHPQRGDGFAQRLANAHADVGRAAGMPVVQIGMDTPHLSVADLRDVVARVGAGNDAVLGPAEDGGWWVLALTDPGFAENLCGVEMSTERTYADTRVALEEGGARVAEAATMRDVDTALDAQFASDVAPGSRFAHRWDRVESGVAL